MALAVAGLFASCKNKTSENPFFTEWNTPYGVPPFEQIKNEHFMPAFEEGMKQHQAEIDAIVNNTEAPTFENTVVALEKSGALLTKVASTFFNLTGSETDSEKQKIEQEISPALSKHSDDIYLNAGLFARVKAVYEQKDQMKHTDQLQLDAEDAMLLEQTYQKFVRNGANLNAEDQAKLRKINEELSSLSVKFTQNVLADNNAFRLVIDKKEDLAGLPESAIEAAAERAKTEKMDGKWVFTIDAASRIPFLQYADKRELREQMFKAYANKGNNNNANDNKEVVSKTASLSYQKAVLLGYKNYAAFELADRMAKTPETVMDFMMRLWKPTQKKTAEELAELQKEINASGENFKLEPWDWFYYTEKLRVKKLNFNEEEVRPYFQIDNVRDGAFMVANKLYGVTLTEIKDIPKFNPQATAYLVKDADGKELAVFYTDYFPRASKRGGAWMSNIREQQGDIRPVIVNICNFTPPTSDKPSLLTVDEVTTLFHEFGHALHGILAKGKYQSISGTNVKRDFVELPSQVNEHWATWPSVLKMYAKHYKTGEVIPDSLIEKIQKSEKFNQGFVTTEFLAAAILDMSWYTLETDVPQDVEKFEKASMDKIGLTYAIIPRYRSTYFNHVFGGGYSAGYYSYIWAEVLDADAFQAFVEAGDVFDPKTAKAFRQYVLEKGGSEDPMHLYKQFRGKEPNPDALLIGRGLK